MGGWVVFGYTAAASMLEGDLATQGTLLPTHSVTLFFPWAFFCCHNFEVQIFSTIWLDIMNNFCGHLPLMPPFSCVELLKTFVY